MLRFFVKTRSLYAALVDEGSPVNVTGFLERLNDWLRRPAQARIPG
jgi:hypothetical protein